MWGKLSKMEWKCRSRWQGRKIASAKNMGVNGRVENTGGENAEGDGSER